MADRSRLFDFEVDDTRVINVDGVWRRDFNAVLPPDMVDQIREGYMCMKCYEPLMHVGAFPDNCPLCGYAVKENQPDDFRMAYKGVEYFGTGGADKQYERSLEAYREEEAKNSARKVGIIVP